ncbi:MAG: hypothetical protein A2W93_05475 [Bacteroidetes bacterium GWF2_43_63]|nr:MAG: hypothetical protein A2W94_07590 [Bacteroidetes bacterium GWE2_42_42]OFY55467.1 MAG: hypothetical protein A2W93_05475 [Bacteroidetes bacterium GWF2_43_63]HBG69942.1 hypothetical protein [Bacteroidales bacterium]HCB62632.1 hypothetical protein [Bacteroidales bacterium]HCY23752.1 hypothetical protein [Bacteroidales bacterium]
MATEKIKILPMEGCSLIRFGASENDVINVIGEPDERENIDDEDYNSEIWYYDEKGVTLFLDEMEDDGLLVSGIELENDNFELEGVSLIGKTIDEIKALAEKLKYGEADVEKEEWGEFRLSYEDKLLDFYFDESKKLISVSLGME